MRATWVVLLLAMCMCSGSALADLKQEGTKWEELAAKHPPQPGEISIVVLPFTIPPEFLRQPAQVRKRQIEITRGSILLNLERHRYRILPEAKSLPLVISKTDEEMAKDSEFDSESPGLADAVRLGQHLGAQWVVFGTYEQAQKFTTGAFLSLSVRRWVVLRVRIVVVDVESEEVVYWQRVEDEARMSKGTAWTQEDAKRLRSLLLGMIGSAFDDIGKAMPKHATGPEVKLEHLDKLIGSMGL